MRNRMMLPYLMIFALVIVSSGMGYICPEPDICVCEGIIFSCTCETRQDVSLPPILHDEIRRMSVKGCGFVNIPFGSMAHLRLETIQFEDIETLKIAPFAFTGVQNIDVLRITNIENLELQPYGFSGVSNVTNIILENVTCPTLKVGAFGGISDIKNFRISGSIFGEVEATAMYVNNVSTFEVTDSIFKMIKNGSIFIHNVEGITFTDSQFYEIDTEALSISNIDNLSFHNCNFGVIRSESIFATNLKTFSVKNCTINELHADAFKEVGVLNYLTYTHNSFVRSYNNSIFPGKWLDKKYQMFRKGQDITGNKFSCVCSLSWIWTKDKIEPYMELLNRSSCIESQFGNETLSSLTSIFDNSGECLGIQDTVIHETATLTSSSVSNNYESEFFIYFNFLWIVHYQLCKIT